MMHTGASNGMSKPKVIKGKRMGPKEEMNLYQAVDSLERDGTTKMSKWDHWVKRVHCTASPSNSTIARSVWGTKDRMPGALGHLIIENCCLNLCSVINDDIRFTPLA